MARTGMEPLSGVEDVVNTVVPLSRRPEKVPCPEPAGTGWFRDIMGTVCFS